METSEYNKSYYRTRFIDKKWSGKGEKRICEGCLNSFTMVRSDQRFCTGKCRSHTAHVNNGRRYHLAKYGLTESQYDRMLEEQNWVCAICHQLPKKNNVLFVDHCHRSQRVRKLLCHKCNALIGLAKESTQTLLNAAEYLKGYNVSV